MRIWAKVFHENHLLRDTVVELEGSETRTEKVFAGLEEACRRLDLAVPIWMETNVKEFRKVAKTRFRQDSFIEGIDFDFLEFHVIEEDPWL